MVTFLQKIINESKTFSCPDDVFMYGATQILISSHFSSFQKIWMLSRFGHYSKSQMISRFTCDFQRFLHEINSLNFHSKRKQRQKNKIHCYISQILLSAKLDHPERLQTDDQFVCSPLYTCIDDCEDSIKTSSY